MIMRGTDETSGSLFSCGHLDFSLFSAVQGRFGGLKPAGSGLLECSAA
jgi:hypothetical protein